MTESKCYGFKTFGTIARLKMFYALLAAANQMLWTGKTIIEIKSMATTPNDPKLRHGHGNNTEDVK
jgi:hypothetical protein